MSPTYLLKSLPFLLIILASLFYGFRRLAAPVHEAAGHGTLLATGDEGGRDKHHQLHGDEVPGSDSFADHDGTDTGDGGGRDKKA